MNKVDKIAFYNLIIFGAICAAFVAKITSDYMDIEFLITHEGFRYFGIYAIFSFVVSILLFFSVNSILLQTICFIFVLLMFLSWFYLGGVKIGPLSWLLSPCLLILGIKTVTNIKEHITH